MLDIDGAWTATHHCPVAGHDHPVGPPCDLVTVPAREGLAKPGRAVKGEVEPMSAPFQKLGDILAQRDIVLDEQDVQP
jgi:hypothetical protein